MSSNEIKHCLSAVRIETYENAVGGSAGPAQTEKTLKLYMWNAQVSAAFFMPLNICEAITRNAIAEVPETVYGAKRPWPAGFEQSLPAPVCGYRSK